MDVANQMQHPAQCHSSLFSGRIRRSEFLEISLECRQYMPWLTRRVELRLKNFLPDRSLVEDGSFIGMHERQIDKVPGGPVVFHSDGTCFTGPDSITAGIANPVGPNGSLHE